MASPATITTATTQSAANTATTVQQPKGPLSSVEPTKPTTPRLTTNASLANMLQAYKSTLSSTLAIVTKARDILSRVDNTADGQGGTNTEARQATQALTTAAADAKRVAENAARSVSAQADAAAVIADNFTKAASVIVTAAAAAATASEATPDKAAMIGDALDQNAAKIELHMLDIDRAIKSAPKTDPSCAPEQKELPRCDAFIVTGTGRPDSGGILHSLAESVKSQQEDVESKPNDEHEPEKAASAAPTAPYSPVTTKLRELPGSPTTASTDLPDDDTCTDSIIRSTISGYGGFSSDGSEHGGNHGTSTLPGSLHAGDIGDVPKPADTDTNTTSRRAFASPKSVQLNRPPAETSVRDLGDPPKISNFPSVTSRHRALLIDDQLSSFSELLNAGKRPKGTDVGQCIKDILASSEDHNPRTMQKLQAVLTRLVKEHPNTRSKVLAKLEKAQNIRTSTGIRGVRTNVRNATISIATSQQTRTARAAGTRPAAPPRTGDNRQNHGLSDRVLKELAEAEKNAPDERSRSPDLTWTQGRPNTPTQVDLSETSSQPDHPQGPSFQEATHMLQEGNPHVFGMTLEQQLENNDTERKKITDQISSLEKNGTTSTEKEVNSCIKDIADFQGDRSEIIARLKPILTKIIKERPLRRDQILLALEQNDASKTRTDVRRATATEDSLEPPAIFKQLKVLSEAGPQASATMINDCIDDIAAARTNKVQNQVLTSTLTKILLAKEPGEALNILQTLTDRGLPEICEDVSANLQAATATRSDITGSERPQVVVITTGSEGSATVIDGQLSDASSDIFDDRDETIFPATGGEGSAAVDGQPSENLQAATATRGNTTGGSKGPRYERRAAQTGRITPRDPVHREQAARRQNAQEDTAHPVTTEAKGHTEGGQTAAEPISKSRNILVRAAIKVFQSPAKFIRKLFKGRTTSQSKPSQADKPAADKRPAASRSGGLDARPAAGRRGGLDSNGQRFDDTVLHPVTSASSERSTAGRSGGSDSSGELSADKAETRVKPATPAEQISRFLIQTNEIVDLAKDINSFYEESTDLDSLERKINGFHENKISQQELYQQLRKVYPTLKQSQQKECDTALIQLNAATAVVKKVTDGLREELFQRKINDIIDLSVAVSQTLEKTNTPEESLETLKQQFEQASSLLQEAENICDKSRVEKVAEDEGVVGEAFEILSRAETFLKTKGIAVITDTQT